MTLPSSASETTRNTEMFDATATGEYPGAWKSRESPLTTTYMPCTRRARADPFCWSSRSSEHSWRTSTTLWWGQPSSGIWSALDKERLARLVRRASSVLGCSLDSAEEETGTWWLSYHPHWRPCLTPIRMLWQHQDALHCSSLSTTVRFYKKHIC